MMKIVFPCVVYFISYCSPCLADEVSGAQNLADGDRSEAAYAAPIQPPASLALIEIHQTGTQFPANLIPAVQIDETADQNAETARAAAPHFALGLNSSIMPDAAPDEPPIVVSGPRLPKPAPLPDDAEVRLQKVRREVARMEIAYHILSLADGIATIHCVSRRTCKELNPLMGSRPSALRVIGVKALAGFFLHRSVNRMAEKNPYRARSFMRIGVVVQAAITGFTMRTSF